MKYPAWRGCVGTYLMPKLFLERGQDTTALAATLARVYPVLAWDGVMKCDILDHDCGMNGSWHLALTSPTTALLSRNGHEDRRGSPEQMLTYVAQELWGHKP